jgi:NTP pyrophosphatase (non-canonical NTP hydrolase)
MDMKMNEIISKIILLGKTDPKNLEAHTLKLMEETGELAEAVNHTLGNLPHKEMKEPLAGEVADVIQCAIAVMCKAYPDMTEGDIFNELNRQLVAKTAKWERVVHMRELTTKALMAAGW